MARSNKNTDNQLVKQDSLSNCLIIHKTVTATVEPSVALRALEEAEPQIALLSFNTAHDSHFSFIGLKPLANLYCKDGLSTITKNDETTTSTQSPFELIKELQQQFIPSNLCEEIRLTASPIVVLAYDAVRYIEDLKSAAKPKDTPDLEVNFYEYGIYFNHQNNSITVSRYIKNSTESDAAQKSLDELITKINSYKDSNQSKQAPKSALKLNINDDDFVAKVNKSKEFIKQGEVFQLVISRQYTKHFNQNPINLYDTLLEVNPSPYHFYVKSKDYVLVAASPEKIVSVNNKKITSVPLAGTRAINGDLDNAISTLLQDEKELAEHMMLVDLARNDIGKVSTPGSVQATKLTYPLVLKNIVHLASSVEGTLAPQYSSQDALLASFPAGTLSGAPKIRAMQLIEKLEPNNRGFYGGCLFTVDHYDNLDSCIIIRHAEITNNTIKVQSGSGIVFDSNPKAESQETKNKAKAMLHAISICESGESL